MKGATEFLDEEDGEDAAPEGGVAGTEAPETETPGTAGETEEANEPPEAEDQPQASAAPTPAGRQMDELLHEFGEALDEIANALQTGRRDTADIGDTLAQMLEVVKSRDRADPMAAMTKAIKALRAVTVQVNPTPVTVTAPPVQIIERSQPVTYEFQCTYDNMDRLKTAQLVPVAVSSDQPADQFPMFTRAERLAAE